ncbi:MAG: (Fe-S)-binding protein [Xanthomonadales bacterium]|nr:(Fe-S)-binding protein [Xanthomonadales bacterium]
MPGVPDPHPGDAQGPGHQPVAAEGGRPVYPDAARLAGLADRCVLCGQCLPACPTYAVAREEGESPRGRIMLARALLRGEAPPSPALVGHFDSCLACRRCEAVCPAGVQYGSLIAGVRALPALAQRRPRWRRLMLRVLSRASLRRWAQAALPLLRPFRRVPAAATPWRLRLGLLAGLPAPVRAAAPVPGRPAPAEVAGDTALWPGCVAADWEQPLHRAAQRLFHALGQPLAMAPALCCGNLALHDGIAEDAARQADALAGRLRASGVRRVLGTASGCHDRARQVLAEAGIEVQELHVALATHPGLARLRFATLPGRVAIHQPCSQRLLGPASSQAVLDLLGRIPGLVPVALPAADRCCGAAGSHFLAQPRQAVALRERVVQDIDAAQPDTVVSTNIGCRLMLSRPQQDGRPTLEILHPVELLARQLLT